VDLLPSPELLRSYCAVPPPGKPLHIARVWGRYNANPSYMGGVVAWNAPDYEVGLRGRGVGAGGVFDRPSLSTPLLPLVLFGFVAFVFF
jgi:hypothetical protein